MSYNENNSNILQWFYSSSLPSNTPNKSSTTNFRINNIDISNNYIGIGTNSNIPVSTLYNIGYYKNGINLGNLFELNLPIFNLFGTTYQINVDFKILPPINNSGLLIQFLRSMSFSFNYNVDCSFVMVGGGGGGGAVNQDNAGGGGGAGQVIKGSMINFSKSYFIEVTIGNGGAGGLYGSPNPNGSNGSSTTIMYTNFTTYYTITANGGGYGGSGKNNSNSVLGSSSGGTGSFSTTQLNPGTATPEIIPNVSIFKNMTSYNNIGARGNDQNNDSGAGGGGGGAGGAAPYQSDQNTPGPGGDGIIITYGNTHLTLAGGGGGGGRQSGYGSEPQGFGGNGGSGVGGDGGGASTQANGYPGVANTGSGGGGACNHTSGSGGNGGSGTVILYILPSGVIN
jgi:hypothetical protein